MAMSSIMINFQNTTLTSSMMQVLITGGNFALDSASALSMAGISFTGLYLTAGAISFNVEPGTYFNATVHVPVNAPGGAPTVEITNVSGTAIVTWPTESGLQTGVVMVGAPLTLDGFVN